MTTRERAIAALNEARRAADVQSAAPSYAGVLLSALDAAGLAVVEKPTWREIDTDGMPQSDGPYWIYPYPGDDGGQHVVLRRWPWSARKDSDLDGVTHWMPCPLPEPPEE